MSLAWAFAKEPIKVVHGRDCSQEELSLLLDSAVPEMRPLVAACLKDPARPWTCRIALEQGPPRQAVGCAVYRNSRRVTEIAAVACAAGWDFDHVAAPLLRDAIQRLKRGGRERLEAVCSEADMRSLEVFAAAGFIAAELLREPLGPGTPDGIRMVFRREWPTEEEDGEEEA